jgi:pterin-4a-carbinolamine dehydratase
METGPSRQLTLEEEARPELERLLAAKRGWRVEGGALTRELTFRDFATGWRYLEQLAETAVDYQRRPDMCILSYNRVRVVIANLKHAGVTLAELRLAAKVDSVPIPEGTVGHDV